MFLGARIKNTEDLSQDNRPSGPDPRPPDYKAGALSIHPLRSVRMYGDLPQFPFISPAETLHTFVPRSWLRDIESNFLWIDE
jgi:hypothetical protein